MNNDFRYELTTKHGVRLFSNLTPNDVEIINIKNSKSNIINKERFLKIESMYGSICAITSNKDMLSSSKKFKTKLEIILDTIPIIENTIELAKEKINNNTKRLIHNLTSINAHSIQEVYSLIPQENINQKIKEQLPEVEKIIKSDIKETSMTLLRIAKYNAAMKAEFSVFKNLFNSNPELQKRTHNVHKVLINIFYIFFPDFTDKNVDINISESNENAFFDYESMHVSLYHLIENATKYIKPNTTMNISIEVKDNFSLISMKMNSLEIKQNEIDKIFDEGFSGELSKKTGKAGDGIGMSIAKKLITLNNGKLSLEIVPNSLSESMNINYQEHILKIELPKKNRPISDNI